MKNFFLKPSNSGQRERRKSKKKTLKGILMGCMAVVGLLIAEPQETKADSVTFYVSTQQQLNEACNYRGTADIYLNNSINLKRYDSASGTYFPTGISVYGVKTLHGNGNTLSNGIVIYDSYANADVKENGAPVFNVANTLTLENVVINGGNAKYRSAIVVNFGGTVNVKSGTYITGCKSWDCGSGTRGGHGIWCREGGVINVYDGSIYGNAQSGIGSSGGTVSVAGGNIYNNGNNGISSYGTLYFHGGTINQNANCGIYVGDGDAYINGGLIAGNRSDASAGIGIQKGDVVMNGGTVNNLSQTGVYLLNGNGTFTMNAGEIYSNAACGITANGGTVTINNGRIHDNGQHGISSSANLTVASGASGTEICNNGGDGIVSFATLNMTGGYVHSNNGTGVVNYGSGTISGGEIRHNKGNSNVVNGTTGTLRMTGGSIYGTAVNGIANSGNLTVTGGEIYECSASGIFHAGTTTIIGGSFRSNGHDVQHFGQENSGNLVIENGAESVWLPTVGRYVVTHSGRRLVIDMPADCYKRGKIMVRTDSAETAQNVTSNLSFRDLNAFTKRAYGNDVVVWDRYKQTSRNYKFESGRWNYFGTDKTETVWGGDNYTVKYTQTPENYRNYAIVRTDPSPAGTTVADTGGQEYVCKNVSAENTFYVCYYPKNYTVHFEGNGATGGSMQDQTIDYGVAAKLNKNGFTRGFTVGYDVNGGNSVERGSDSVVSDFTGWKLSPAAVGISYTDEQSVMNIAEPGKTRNLYAAWHDNAVTLPNASKADEYWEVSEDNKGWVRYYFTGWYTAPDGGVCVGRGGDAYTPKQDITLYAHWTYNVFVYYDGNTNDGGGMEMTDPVKGDEKTRGVDYIIRENNFTKTGYDFAGWNTAQVDGDGNIVETGLPRFTPGSIYNEDIPLTLFAAWQHRFDIAYMGVCQTEGDDYLDNNGGADYSQLTDTVKLAKSDDLKIQTTKSYVDDEVGTITEDVTATGVGWAFAKDMEAKYPETYIADDTEYPAGEFFALARDAGAVTYGNVSPDYQGEVPQLNSQDMAVANMYRVWDYGPLIKATDRYFTLKQAHDGFITEEELFRSVTAEDDEDGQLVKKTEADVAATGSDEGVTMLNYLAEKWTTFPCAGSATLTYVAKDSAGNVTEYMVTIHITDTKPIDDSGDEDGRVVRGISRKYYNTYQNGDYGWDTYSNYGGLYPDSVWYKDPEYRSCIEEAFSNEENDTPEQIWEFGPEDHAKVKQWIEEHGVGNSKEPDGLKKFYEEFSYCRKK